VWAASLDNVGVDLHVIVQTSPPYRRIIQPQRFFSLYLRVMTYVPKRGYFFFHRKVKNKMELAICWGGRKKRSRLETKMAKDGVERSANSAMAEISGAKRVLVSISWQAELRKKILLGAR
jgi:hypothetical protein